LATFSINKKKTMTHDFGNASLGFGHQTWFFSTFKRNSAFEIDKIRIFCHQFRPLSNVLVLKSRSTTTREDIPTCRNKTRHDCGQYCNKTCHWMIWNIGPIKSLVVTEFGFFQICWKPDFFHVRSDRFWTKK
jgi:hypothetical protein